VDGAVAYGRYRTGQAALEVQTFCTEQDWRFCFIGAEAVQRWGEQRLTLAVDLTLLTGFGDEARFGRPGFEPVGDWD